MPSPYRPRSPASRCLLAASLTAAFNEGKLRKDTSEEFASTYEEVWYFQTSNPQVRVLVYSTIVEGSVRAVGTDALRVCAVYRSKKDGREYGIVKATRVNRTGTVEAIVMRTKERIREVFNAARRPNQCHCGAPKFLSKAKNEVCAEFCWKDGSPQGNAGNRRAA
jgi:hypothetical protein